MLLIEKLFFFALGIVCGGGLVAFFAGAHVQGREYAAYAWGRREGIEKARGKTAEPIEEPGEASPVMASCEPRPEEIAAARRVANSTENCWDVPCDNCPGRDLPEGWNCWEATESARAWLASHSIPVEEAAS